MAAQITDLFATLAEHDRKFNSSVSLIPSENLLSPLARAAYLSDSYSRYFFDEREAFGRWSFQGGSIAGRVQQEIVVPLLRELGRAEHVNLHAISGLSGMTLALAAFGGDPGNRVLSVPVTGGGHPDTRYVAEKLGYVVHDLPFDDYATLNLERLADLVAAERPSLVYVDHASALVPLPLAEVIGVIRNAAVAPVHIHVDSSHVNGLIWGGVLTNPLEAGADSYGGSTHKTFPGPHKAALLTNDPDVAERLLLTGVNMISHHHLASVVALGVSLLEFRDRGGDVYARQIVRNARAFAAALAERGVDVQGDAADGYTRTHHVWADVPAGAELYPTAERLFAGGLVVNPFNPLPSLGGPGIRMGVNEVTKLGMTEPAMVELADAFAAVVLAGADPNRIAGQVARLRAEFAPAYCYRDAEMREALAEFVETLTDDRRHYVAATDPRPAVVATGNGAVGEP
jgi:glycine/serine hydroxymethyltransferase